MLDNKNSASECAKLVKTERPNAIGMTWYNDGSNQCYAEIGNPSTARIVQDDLYVGCLFSGKYIVTETFIYINIKIIVNNFKIFLFSFLFSIVV